jgi:putative membrane protein
MPNASLFSEPLIGRTPARGRAVAAGPYKAIATAALVGLVPVGAAAQPRPNASHWHYPHMMGDGGWLAMIFGPIFMLVPLVVLIAVVVLAARGFSGPWRFGDRASERTPLDLLKERFARGEIDKEEYEERRRILSE